MRFQFCNGWSLGKYYDSVRNFRKLSQHYRSDPNITERQPSFNVEISNWNIPKSIQLADPRFYTPQRVDLLVGASLFYEMLCVGQIKLPPGTPLIQKTRLG